MGGPGGGGGLLWAGRSGMQLRARFREGRPGCGESSAGPEGARSWGGGAPGGGAGGRRGDVGLLIPRGAISCVAAAVGVGRQVGISGVGWRWAGLHPDGAISCVPAAVERHVGIRGAAGGGLACTPRGQSRVCRAGAGARRRADLPSTGQDYVRLVVIGAKSWALSGGQRQTEASARRGSVSWAPDVWKPATIAPSLAGGHQSTSWAYLAESSSSLSTG